MNSLETEALFKKFLRNECSEEEAIFVLDWLARNKDDPSIQAFIAESFNDRYPETTYSTEKKLQDILEKNESAILQKINEPVAYPAARKTKWYKTLAAAALLLSVCTAAYLWVNNSTEQHSSSIVRQGGDSAVQINPGSSKAVLTLANGDKIILEDKASGQVATEGNIQINQLNGQLIYQSAAGTDPPVYNTIATPAGGQYQLVLADGTKAWLNAASTLRFPATFIKDTRVVELTGEAYFEVAKDASRPFYVKTATTMIKVLGTHFNVMAYGDEKVQQTTLAEGSVSIARNGQREILLKPGQQAAFYEKDGTLKVTDVDVAEAMAWKNGYFQFNRNADIQTLMRQIARWYNIEVEYAGVVPERRFGGKISRNSNLSDILKMMELNKIHYKTAGRKLIIMP